MKFSLRSRIFCVGLLLALSGLGQSFAASNVEVSQSVPLETESSLDIPSIRQTQKVWLEMIRTAQSSIDLEEFYIADQPNEALGPVLGEIKKAAAKGVKIRFLLDSKFFKNYPDTPLALSKIQGIQVKKIDFSAGVQHSKYMVIDQKEVFVGSANFDWLALSHIHEVGLRIQDAQVANKLGSVFQKDWAQGTSVHQSNPDDGDTEGDTGEENRRRTSSPSNPPTVPVTLPLSDQVSKMEVVASPPTVTPDGVGDSLTAITELLAKAKKSVQIQVYQYNTKGKGKRWTVLDAAIRKAAANGAHVQVLVDKIAMKTGSSDLKALAGTQNIEVRTVTIPEWSGGPLQYARLVHSKYLVVDGVSAWVGTENWSQDYFTQSRNVGVILRPSSRASERGDGVVVQLGQIFNRVWESPYAARL